MAETVNKNPLPAEKLCNKSAPVNCPSVPQDKRHGPLGNESDGKMYYDNQDGDKEELVKTLQQILNELGYSDDEPLEVDGKFGKRTEQALIKFQRDKKNKDWEGKPLKDDGLVGPRTSDALNRSMVGLWYDTHITPKNLTENFLLVTALRDALQEELAINFEDVNKVSIALVLNETLSATLFDDGYGSILSNVPYELEGPDGELLTGVTDDDGHLEHANVKPGIYKVKVDNSFALISSISDVSVCHQRIPAVIKSEEAEDETGEVVTDNESAVLEEGMEGG